MYSGIAPAAAAQEETAPEPAPPPPSEEDRLKTAGAAYRRHRTLALQAQVAEGDLKAASLAWQAERDAFPEGARALLDKATKRIDQEIAAERALPARHPNQLPGAIRREPEGKK